MILNDSLNSDEFTEAGGSVESSAEQVFTLIPGGFPGSMPVMVRSVDGSYIMSRMESVVSRFIDPRFYGVVWVEDLYVLGINNRDLRVDFIPVEYVFKKKYVYELYYLATNVGSYVVGGAYDQKLMVYDPDTGDIYTTEISNIKPGDHLVHMCAPKELPGRHVELESDEEAEGLLAGYLYAMAKLGLGFRLGPRALYLNLDTMDPNDLILILKSLDMISTISKIDRMENSIAVYSDTITNIVRSVTRGIEVKLPNAIYSSRAYAYGFVRGLVNIARNSGEGISRLPEIYWVSYMHGIRINGIENKDQDMGIGYDEMASKDRLGVKGICTCRVNRIIIRKSSDYVYGLRTSQGTILSGIVPVISGEY